MHCRNCRHDLTGIESGRCPECGQQFDRANPATWASDRADFRGSTLRIVAVVAVLTVLAYGLIAVAALLWLRFAPLAS